MLGSLRRLIEDWRSELGETYILGLVRVALGMMLFWQALERGRQLATRGYFGATFHLPILPDTLVPPRLAYTLIVAALIILAALVTVGHHARGSMLASAGLGSYVLLCDRLELSPSRYALLCVTALLALSPCDRWFVITGSPVGSRMGALWAQRLAQLQLSLIYFAGGSAKLLDADWRNGLVLADRIARHAGGTLVHRIPPCVLEFFAQPLAASALAKAAIATELFLAIGLWLRRTRVFALWWGVMFHLTIQAMSEVNLFTALSLVVYGLFATPDLQARKLYFDPSRARGISLARLVSLLDWLARFEIRPWAPDAIRKGHSVVIVRRDGSRATGVRAFAMVARCVPLLFPLWAPLALVASFTKGGEASARV